MRPLGMILGILFGIGALAACIWAARYAPWVQPYQTHLSVQDQGRISQDKEKKQFDDEKAKFLKAEAAKLPQRPAIVDKPPFPKAVTGERVFDFGAMGVGEEKSHIFHIENKGQTPLLLAKGPTTCKCTIANISSDGIPPNGSAEIKLSWTPKKVEENFAQDATIFTNDPNLSEFQFKIYGKVVEQFTLIPERTWNAGHITDIQDGHTTATLASRLDPSFKITSIDTPDPHVKVEYRKFEARELVYRHAWRAAYEINVTVDRGIPTGPFRGRIKIHTTLEGNKTVDAELKATRSGPILFLPPVGKAIWNVEKSRLGLGVIQSNEGKKVALPALVYGMKDKFQALKCDSDADFLKVRVDPDPENSKGEQQGIRFVFEVPRGAPAVTRMRPNSAHVVVQTNHPRLKEIPFEVDLLVR